MAETMHTRDDGMTGLRLVPERATETMLRAMDEMYMPLSEMLAAWDGALAAAPELAPEQIDKACARMRPVPPWWWREEHDNDPPHRQSQIQRQADRYLAKCLLRALQQPADEQVERTVG